ncbi:MAG: hypothetical protein ACD_77C00156G0004 [uncultured bacterium]|nr:MAG: hypothetical protein ACD_77C00156G0004 [uncultured bacterium]
MKNTNKFQKKLFSLLNLVLYITMITVNALANTLPINGKTTGDVSGSYPNLFAPAAITFSIWGVIYILLLFFVIYDIYTAFGKGNIKTTNVTSSLVFSATCLLNSLWIFAWHYELILLSVIIMLALLSSLIYLSFLVNNQNITGFAGKLALKTSVGVYFGWISVATIANITVLLVSLNWDGFGISENIWTIVMVSAGTLLAVLMLIKNKDIAYSLVVIWAYCGIIIKRSGADIIHNDIIYTCYIAILIIIALILYTSFLKRRKLYYKNLINE